MTENHVLDLIVSHYEDNGWECFYRTNRDAHAPGMDAALFCNDSNRFVIIEAKGDPPETNKNPDNYRSRSLTEVLGTILKRIKIECGYDPGNVTKENFRKLNGINEDMYNYMSSHASLKNCEYVLAIPESYSDGITRSLDPQLAVMLNIVVYIVSGSDVTRLYW